jgi:hypothetical protein
MVTEQTARRIADALERLLKAVEGQQAERFVGGVRHQPWQAVCPSCGGLGGYHSVNCPHGLSGSPRF